MSLCLLTLTLLGRFCVTNSYGNGQAYWNKLLEKTFKLCKTDFRREKYLDLSPHLRSAVTKLHLSCHPLYIEPGIYHKPHAVRVEERTCIFFRQLNRERDPFPVSMHRPEYKLFITTFSLTTYKHLTLEEKWRILWIKVKENSNQMIILAKYICAAFLSCVKLYYKVLFYEK